MHRKPSTFLADVRLASRTMYIGLLVCTAVYGVFVGLQSTGAVTVYEGRHNAGFVVNSPDCSKAIGFELYGPAGAGWFSPCNSE